MKSTKSIKPGTMAKDSLIHLTVTVDKVFKTFIIGHTADMPDTQRIIDLKNLQVGKYCGGCGNEHPIPNEYRADDWGWTTCDNCFNK